MFSWEENGQLTQSKVFVSAHWSAPCWSLICARSCRTSPCVWPTTIAAGAPHAGTSSPHTGWPRRRWRSKHQPSLFKWWQTQSWMSGQTNFIFKGIKSWAYRRLSTFCLFCHLFCIHLYLYVCMTHSLASTDTALYIKSNANSVILQNEAND